MSKILITSALPYVNGIPHLGHLVGCLLPSDVYARFMRMSGNEVLYICGTDEHGTPSEVGAAKENMPVEEYCTKYHNRHKEVYKKFNLSFDFFGRTSTPQNEEATYHIFNKLDENGFIEERNIKQVFSIDDNRFLPDRYITGTCPHCGYDKARGDQCENCTRVLEPTDLINPRSTISGSTNLEVRETKHLFLKLPVLGVSSSQSVSIIPPAVVFCSFSKRIITLSVMACNCSTMCCFSCLIGFQTFLPSKPFPPDITLVLHHQKPARQTSTPKHRPCPATARYVF